MTKSEKIMRMKFELKDEPLKKPKTEIPKLCNNEINQRVSPPGHK